MTTISDDLRPSWLDPPRSNGRAVPTIAHIATRYLRGGSERRIRDLVRSFPEGRHHLLVGDDSDLELALHEVGPGALTVIPTLVRRPDPWRDAVTLWRLTHLLRAGGYDLVVTHQSKAGILGRVAARICSVPVIHSLSMASFGDGYPGWQSLLFRSLEARLARSTSAFAVVGTDLSSRYIRIGVPTDKLHIVRSGVRLPGPGGFAPREEICHEHDLPAERPLILYLGSLEPRKNVSELPEYLDRVVGATAGPRPFLAIAGDGPLFERLGSAFAEADLATDIALLGYVADPLPLVRAADLMVLLSSAEGVPQALVQAAATGTPFVAYDVDGVGELIGMGADGIAVPLGDLAAISSASVARLRQGRRRTHVPIDLSTWSERSIAEGYRRLVRATLATTSTDGSAGVDLEAIT